MDIKQLNEEIEKIINDKDTPYQVYLKNQHDQFLKDREEEFRIYCQKGYSAAQKFVKEWNKKYQNEMKRFDKHIPTFEELWDAEIEKGNPINNNIATNIVRSAGLSSN